MAIIGNQPSSVDRTWVCSAVRLRKRLITFAGPGHLSIPPRTRLWGSPGVSRLRRA